MGFSLSEDEMKILHTGDWHIGRVLDQHSLIDDQRYALQGFLTIVHDVQPDVILIAGDLYDRAIPPREALELVDETLTHLILDDHIPVIVIGGNHDGRSRLDYGSAILARKGLYFRGAYDPEAGPIEITGQGDTVPTAFWAVPFIKPVEYHTAAKTESIPDYNGMYADIVAQIRPKMNFDQPNVLISHGLILSAPPTAGTLDDSVRPIEIGGIAYASSHLFSDFDYVALGHLHRPQKVGSNRIRYAGSLLKYSFSEVNQKKSAAVVTLDPNRQTLPEVELIPIPAKRDLRIISGPFDDLTGLAAYTQENRDDYIKAVLTDKIRVTNPMDGLREVYPNVLEMTYAHSQTVDGTDKKRRIKEHLNDPMTLFSDFYETIRGEALPEEEATLAKSLFDAAHAEDGETQHTAETAEEGASHASH